MAATLVPVPVAAAGPSAPEDPAPVEESQPGNRPEASETPVSDAGTTEDEDPWADYERASEAGTPEAPAPDPAPAPSPAETEKPRPRKPRNGLGLLIAGPLVATAGVPLSLWGNRSYRNTCVRNAMTEGGSAEQELIVEPVGCILGALGSMFLHSGAFLLYAGGVAMTGGGAILRGRSDAWDDAFTTDSVRDTLGLKIGGGVLAGVSAALLVTSRIAIWQTLDRCGDLGCVRLRQTMATTLVGASVIGLGAGVGMLGYGLAYDKGFRRYAPDLALLPALGPSHVGLSVGGRF